MSIKHYIKEIGRGKAGARALGREQAFDLMGQLLDGVVSDLEVGAFCLAMRVKGETRAEMLGFLDAAHARVPVFNLNHGAWVVLPSYNGARKLPVLTPLLAGLLAAQGLNVLVHGPALDAGRTTSAQVWQALGWAEIDSSKIVARNVINTMTSGQFFIKTHDLCPGLAELLAVRGVVGVRNSAHSLVKLLNPLANSAVQPAQCLVVGSYTHPEYAELMQGVLPHMPYASMLLRGTEGEPVADARRRPQLQVCAGGESGWTTAAEAQTGSLGSLPELARSIDATSIADYTRAVLAGVSPVPEPIAAQVDAICGALNP